MEILGAEEAIPLRGRGAPKKYPWDSWFKSGQTTRIFKGEDFTVDTVTMRQMVYQKAKGYGGRVSTTLGRDVHDRECIDMTFYAHVPVDEDIWPEGLEERDPRGEPLRP